MAVYYFKQTAQRVVTLEEQKKQQHSPRQLTPEGSSVAGECFNDITENTISSLSMAPSDPRQFFPFPSTRKEKFPLSASMFRHLILSFYKDASSCNPLKRQSRRKVTLLDKNCQMALAETERYQLSRQDASVNHVRSPLGRLPVFPVFSCSYLA
ncbi:unnamed protein product [Thelazia callipaeda]|uniref:Uncharacterized protein n=1 Tax=Thelazia callipaeda TaxID=103827 RepID=A0A0N5D9F9_THECL|nr:unnamed protein product [Thelazia callipaeda]